MSRLHYRVAALSAAFVISLLATACGNADLTLPGSAAPTVIVTPGGTVSPAAGTPVPTATTVCGQRGTTCATGEDCCSGVCTSSDGITFLCQ